MHHLSLRLVFLVGVVFRCVCRKIHPRKANIGVESCRNKARRFVSHTKRTPNIFSQPTPNVILLLTITNDYSSRCLPCITLVVAVSWVDSYLRNTTITCLWECGGPCSTPATMLSPRTSYILLHVSYSQVYRKASLHKEPATVDPMLADGWLNALVEDGLAFTADKVTR